MFFFTSLQNEISSDGLGGKICFMSLIRLFSMQRAIEENTLTVAKLRQSNFPEFYLFVTKK